VPAGAIRIVSLYLPNGNPVGTDKFDYKLRWMERLSVWAAERLRLEEAFILAGDFNVIPEPRDARFPANWTRDALFQPEPRQAFRRLLNQGLIDAFRATSQAEGHYTFWDYQAGAWQKNNGIRIDHMLLSPLAADRLNGAAIDRRPRGWDKPSDHVPLMIDIAV
jgi:exodeoxyribonuclease-3